MSRIVIRAAAILFAAAVSAPVVLAQSADDATRYIDALTRKGYLTSVDTAPGRSTAKATVGPKMQFIRAAESRHEICMQLLSFARATNREVFRAELVDDGGQRIAGCRLGQTP